MVGLVDFGRTADDYSRYRQGFPPELKNRLADFGVGCDAGQLVLDLGTGTGTLARLFAAGGAVVVGLDRAAPLVAAATGLDAAASVPSRYVIASAERVPVRAGALDAVTAGQCWHWFERGQAAAEARRVLRPGGHLVIAHFDWVPQPGNVAAATEDLIRQWNPAWALGGGTGMYPAWFADLADAGFVHLRSFSFDVDVAYHPLDWRGRIRASAGVAASLDPPQVAQFDQALHELLQRRFPTDPLVILHRVFAVIGDSPFR